MQQTKTLEGRKQYTRPIYSQYLARIGQYRHLPLKLLLLLFLLLLYAVCFFCFPFSMFPSPILLHDYTGFTNVDSDVVHIFCISTTLD